jgi:hypothetical protein
MILNRHFLPSGYRLYLIERYDSEGHSSVMACCPQDWAQRQHRILAVLCDKRGSGALVGAEIAMALLRTACENALGRLFLRE